MNDSELCDADFFDKHRVVLSQAISAYFGVELLPPKAVQRFGNVMGNKEFLQRVRLAWWPELVDREVKRQTRLLYQ